MKSQNEPNPPTRLCRLDLDKRISRIRIVFSACGTSRALPSTSSSLSAFFQSSFLRTCAHQHLRRSKHATSVNKPLLYMTMHLLPPVGSLGFWLRSTSPMTSSKLLITFSLYRAEASVHAHLNSSARAFPSSGVTWRCSGRRSDLLPTTTRGTQSTA